MAEIMDMHPLAERVYVALDDMCAGRARAVIQRLAPLGVGFKIGLQLMNQPQGCAFDLAREIAEHGNGVMWDAKLHDTPTTVAAAMRSLLKSIGQQINIVTVHTAGGLEMLEQTMEVVDRHHKYFDKRPLVVGVTVPTSLDLADLRDQNIQVDSVAEQVVALAQLAMSAGIDGVVASVHEVAAIEQVCGTSLVVITPGLVWDEQSRRSGQKRTATLQEAGASHAYRYVLGRIVTSCPRADEVTTLVRVLNEIQRGVQRAMAPSPQAEGFGIRRL